MDDDRWLIDTKPSSNLPVYTRFNANDVLPDPITPLGASMAWIPHILPGFSLSYAEMGAVTFKEAMNDDTWPAAGFFYGHLYVSVTMARLTGIRSGLGWQAIDQAFFGSHPDAPPHTERPDDSDEGAVAAISARTQWTLTTTTFPDLEEDRALANSQREQRPDLAAMSSLALVARARSMMPLERLMWRGELISGAQAAVGPAVIAQAIAGLEGVKVIDLIGPAGDIDSAAPSFVLWDLGRKVRADAALTSEFDSGLAGLAARLSAYPDFSSDFADFLRLYGYRGPSEWDLGAEAWETRPELALALVERLRLLDDGAAPSIMRQRQIDAAQAALEGVEEQLAGNEELLGLLHIGLASARRFAGWRERGKSNCIKVLHEARMAMRELAGRLVADGFITDPLDVFMALDGELDVFALDPASLTATLAERHIQWLDLFDVQLPLFVSGDKPMIPLSALPRKTNVAVAPAAAGAVLVGQPASAGVVRGQARLITDPGSVRDFQPGDILIAPQTDPSWTPLFMVASAVVVGVGALVSHAMIVSRELGIPCVAGVENAMSLIPDGTIIEVDGSAGTVTIVEAALATV
jgi:phosphohistidine swiveling domain-containing protein